MIGLPASRRSANPAIARQVILMRVMIYDNLERWEEAVIIGKGALRRYPGLRSALRGDGPHATESQRAGGSERATRFRAGSRIQAECSR